MKKLLSLALSFAFLFSSCVPAFAEACNYKRMLESKTALSWFEPECIIGFTCKYLNNAANRKKYLEIAGKGYDTYKGYVTMILPGMKDGAYQDKFFDAAHIFVAAYGYNGKTSVLLANGEWGSRPITTEEKEHNRRLLQQACTKKTVDSFDDKLENERDRVEQEGAKKGTKKRRSDVVADLEYINAENIYPSNGKSGNCGQDLASTMKSQIKAIYNEGKKDKKTGRGEFDIHKIVKQMVDNGEKAKCDDTAYLTSQNLRYLFLAYAALLDNNTNDINKLIDYIKNDNYSKRVQAAAANAAMAFSKYSVNAKDGSKKHNAVLGTLDYTEKQREFIAAGVSLEYMRAGLSEEGYKLYKQNIDRVIEGYDKSTLAVVDRNGNVVQKADMPTFVIALMLTSVAGMPAVPSTAAVATAGGGIVYEGLPNFGGTLIRHLTTQIDLTNVVSAVGRAGPIVMESSIFAAALSIPIITIIELNKAFSASYLRVRKEAVNNYVSSLISGATTALANFEYVYSRDIPIGVMEMVRGTDKITISKSKADTWEITLDRTNPNRVTCREINTAPIITEYCMNNLNQCIKTQYLNTENAKSLLEASGYSDPSFQKALKYEDRIASTKYPSQPLTWRVVHNPLTGGWTPYGELPLSLGEVSKGDLIKITSQFTKDEVYEIFKGVFNGGIKLTCNGTTIRIGADEMQPGTSRGEPNTHLHFEEIQYFKDAQPYICNHAVYFLMPPAGNKNLNIGHYLEMLWKIFY